jgi:hypothetical protein
VRIIPVGVGPDGEHTWFETPLGQRMALTGQKIAPGSIWDGTGRLRRYTDTWQSLTFEGQALPRAIERTTAGDELWAALSRHRTSCMDRGQRAEWKDLLSNPQAKILLTLSLV